MTRIAAVAAPYRKSSALSGWSAWNVAVQAQVILL